MGHGCPLAIRSNDPHFADGRQRVSQGGEPWRLNPVIISHQNTYHAPAIKKAAQGSFLFKDSELWAKDRARCTIGFSALKSQHCLIGRGGGI